MATRHVKMELTPIGLGSTVEVDGLDISASVNAVKLVAMVGEPTRLVVDLIGPVTSLEGDMEVEFVTPGPDTFLAGINPRELESEALKHQIGTNGNLVDSVLHILKERARASGSRSDS